MEELELIGMEDNEKIKDIEEKLVKEKEKKIKKIPKTKDEQSVRKVNKIQKYIIIIMLCVTVFLSYHFLMQYSENLKNTLETKQRLLLNYKENIKGSEKELNLSEYENEILQKEINELKEQYMSYNVSVTELKNEKEKIGKQMEEAVLMSQRYRSKYEIYKKKFENMSNIFHSFSCGE